MDSKELIELFLSSEHKSVSLALVVALLWVVRELWVIKRRVARSKQVRMASIMRGLTHKLDENTRVVERLTTRLEALDELDIPQMKEDVARLDERTTFIEKHLVV